MASVDLSSITDTHYKAIGINGDFNHDEVDQAAAQSIYGRNRETLILQKAYQRLLHTNQAQTVIVHGKSGTGKTALVDTLRDSLCSGNIPGYFVAGKYFQHAADSGAGSIQEPHSAITAAFSDLCDLVIQSEKFDESRRLQIKWALGSNAPLLSKSISNLAPFIDDTQEIEIVEASQVGKFKAACKAFLRAMASDKSPVVIFLDDIQWADEGSNQLIKGFLDDSEIRNVMFILAYREEQSPQVLRDVVTHLRNPIDIILSNLDPEAVHQMVSGIVGSASEGVRGLSELVAKRTAGNPFYVGMLMETLQREGLLVFERHKELCTFSVETIQMTIMASDTLADLLGRKIEQLSVEVKETLKIASLLGYFFEKAIVVEVASIAIEAQHFIQGTNSSTNLSQSSRLAVIAALACAVTEGFIETTSNGYQFTHDKLQASFGSLIDRPQQDRLNQMIGRAFMSETDEKSRIYKAAVHLNQTSSFRRGNEQRTALARINLTAAKYCDEKSAFIQGASMLRTGLEALDPTERWSTENFALTFEIMENLARTQLIVGDFEGCKLTTNEALKHGKTVEMKIDLLLINVEVQMVGIEVNKALSSAFAALRILGASIPRKIKQIHVVGKLFKVRRMLKRTTDEELANFPMVENRLANNAVKLLMHVCTYCLIKDEINSGIYSALVALELTLSCGFLSPHSSNALVLYGFAEMALGNIDRAYNYGKMALALTKRMSCKEAECSTVVCAITLLTWWKDHYNQLFDPLGEAAHRGYQRGDVLFATHCLSQCYQLHINIGTNLANVEESLRKKYEMVSDLSQDGMLLWFQPVLQFVINLQSDTYRWDTISILSGEIMDEDEYFRHAKESGHAVLVIAASLLKAQIACNFEQYSTAAMIHDTIEACDEGMRLGYQAPLYFWNAARTYFGHYDQTGKRLFLRKGRRYKRLLQKMVSAGCVNAAPLLAFLVAQESAQRISREDKSALHGVYRRGIDHLAERQLFHYEGLLNEKAGFDFARRGWHVEAQRYFQRALHIYKHDWGATAKYNWLNDRRMKVSTTAAELFAVNVPDGIIVS